VEVLASALMLDCTAGLEPGDPYTAPMSERSFLEATVRPPRTRAGAEPAQPGGSEGSHRL
jgi:hypothetical protein